MLSSPTSTPACGAVPGLPSHCSIGCTAEVRRLLRCEFEWPVCPSDASPCLTWQELRAPMTNKLPLSSPRPSNGVSRATYASSALSSIPSVASCLSSEDDSQDIELGSANLFEDRPHASRAWTYASSTAASVCFKEAAGGSDTAQAATATMDCCWPKCFLLKTHPKHDSKLQSADEVLLPWDM